MESKEEDSTYNAETEPRYIKNADGSFQIPLAANYQQTKYWLSNLIDLAINRNSVSTLEEWQKRFKSDLRNEAPEVVFKRHKEAFLKDRSEYYRYANLYDDFIDDFEDEGKVYEDVLQRLTQRVHHMYLNDSHMIEPDRLIMRLYSIHYMLAWLNRWMVKYIPHFDLKTLDSSKPSPVYSVPPMPVKQNEKNASETPSVSGDKHTEGKVEVKRSPKRRLSTLLREERIKKDVNEYMLLEGKLRSEAMQLAAEREGVGLDTVERALGMRKR